MALLATVAPLFFVSSASSTQKIHPTYLEVLRWMNAKEWDKAIARSKELIRAHPNRTAAYKTFVAASVGKHDVSAAHAYLQSLLAHQPGNARILYARALCFKEEKHYAAARQSLHDAIQQDAGLAEAFVELGDLYKAMNDLESGIAFFTHYITAHPDRANGYLGLGHCYSLKPDLDRALRQFNEAIARDANHVTAHRRRSLLYFQLGNYEAYLKACERIARLAAEQEDDEALYKNAGNLALAYVNRNRRSQAIQQYTQAWELARQAGDKKQQIFDAYAIGTLRIGLGDPQEALRPLEDALQLSQELKPIDPSYAQYYEAWTLVRMGEIYYRLGDRDQAREHYKKALDRHREIKDAEGICYGDKATGDLEDMIGEHDKAIGLYQKALAQVKRLDPGARDRNEGLIVSLLGLMYIRKKDYPKALDYYKQALALAEKSQDELRIEEALGRIGSIYLWAGDLPAARVYLDRALTLAQKTEQNEHAGFWWNRLGDLYLKLGQREEADRAYEKAARIGGPLKSARMLREAAQGRGQVLEAQGDPQGALRFYNEAVALVEAERDRFLLEREKSGFLEDKLEVYERVVHLLLGRYDQEQNPTYLTQAFHYVERARAQGLLQSLPQGQLLKYLKRTSAAYQTWNTGYEQEQNQIYQQLLQERARLEALRHEDKIDEPAINEQKSKIAHLEQERLDQSETAQRRFLNTMRERIPGLADLYKPKILDARGVQQRLGEHEVLIDYHMQQENTVTFIIGKQKIDMVQLPLGRDHREELMKIIRQVNRTAGGDPETEADPFAKLHTLYEQVFAPVASYLEPDSELIMVRDDVLNYLPFGLLVPEAGGERPKFLIERYPISYVDSASLLDAELWAERKPRGRAGLDLLALGSPDFGGKLLPLPHTAGEVEKIRSHFKRAVVRIGPAATEAAFKSEAGRARLLHMATHGALDAETVWHSKIELALAPAIDQQGEDGHLYTYEIFNLDLVADLVVLSACQSGLGKLRAGEGLVGMSRAFLYAGAPSLVATLWSIPDRATSELMGKFYGYLRQGMNKRRALQKAQTDLIQEGYTDPFYWAAFILIGDASQIKITDASSSFLPMAVILLLALLVLLASAMLLRKNHNPERHG